MKFINGIKYKAMGQKLIEEINNLCRKADQTRSIQSAIKDRVAFWNTLFTLYVTVGSAISAMLIFADINPQYQVYVAWFLASVFIASLIPSALHFDLKILERTNAVQVWGEWLKDAQNFCNTDSSLSEQDFNIEQKKLVDAYKKVMERTPQIPENNFNKYKQKHLQKVAISKALGRTPFKSLRQIKKELVKKEDNVV